MGAGAESKGGAFATVGRENERDTDATESRPASERDLLPESSTEAGTADGRSEGERGGSRDVYNHSKRDENRGQGVFNASPRNRGPTSRYRELRREEEEEFGTRDVVSKTRL